MTFQYQRWNVKEFCLEVGRKLECIQLAAKCLQGKGGHMRLLAQPGCMQAPVQVDLGAVEHPSQG